MPEDCVPAAHNSDEILPVGAGGLSIPLIVISSVGGELGKKIKDNVRVTGKVFDKIIGVVIVLIGIYFLYLAFH